jgi:hypothetical protein
MSFWKSRHAEDATVRDELTGFHLEQNVQRCAADAMKRGQVFTCVSLWAPTNDDIESLARSLHQKLRGDDLAAYLGDGHFVLLLLNTPIGGARAVLARMLSGQLGVTGGCASFPGDGRTFDELLACAKFRGVELRFDEAA